MKIIHLETFKLYSWVILFSLLPVSVNCTVQSDLNLDFFSAIFKGSVAEIEESLKKGANINATENGMSTLLVAAFQGDEDVIELLRSKGLDVNEKNCDHWTALHVAAFRGKEEAVRLLLSKGADANIRDLCHSTPLHEAAIEGNTNVVKLLLAGGANIHAADADERTPLHRAVVFGRKNVVELLLAAGADINAIDYRGETALSIAACGQKEIVELLLARGALPDIKDKDSGQTALHKALLLGYGVYREIISLLLAYGADVHAKTHDGRTVLHYAVRYNDLEVTKLLLAHEADVNAKDNYELTPLAYAQSSDVTDFLISKGAKKNNFS